MLLRDNSVVIIAVVAERGTKSDIACPIYLLARLSPSQGLITAFISKTIIVYRPQTTYFKLTCRASDYQDFVNTELLH
jgi:hypothetical protein